MRAVFAALLVVVAPAARAQASGAVATSSPEPRQSDEAAPAVYAFPATDLRVTLPAGWAGAHAAADAEQYAFYTFTNENAAHPLAGTVLRIERVQGLNQLLRERWQRGQTSYGYHGARPTGPLAAPLPGTALELRGAGTAGAVVFFQRGVASWAVQIEAPAAVWAASRDEVLAVLTGVAVP